jgi:hypothetical protein
MINNIIPMSIGDLFLYGDNAQVTPLRAFLFISIELKGNAPHSVQRLIALRVATDGLTIVERHEPENAFWTPDVVVRAESQ